MLVDMCYSHIKTDEAISFLPGLADLFSSRAQRSALSDYFRSVEGNLSPRLTN
jgi:hypothetical protein